MSKASRSSSPCPADGARLRAVIDDVRGHTLASASTLEADVKGKLKTGADVAAAKEIGLLLAERAVKAGVKQVVFDRSGYLYHGRVKALADAAREGGLEF